jgi:hypothetical protein
MLISNRGAASTLFFKFVFSEVLSVQAVFRLWILVSNHLFKCVAVSYELGSSEDMGCESVLKFNSSVYFFSDFLRAVLSLKRGLHCG